MDRPFANDSDHQSQSQIRKYTVDWTLRDRAIHSNEPPKNKILDCPLGHFLAPLGLDPESGLDSAGAWRKPWDHMSWDRDRALSAVVPDGASGCKGVQPSTHPRGGEGEGWGVVKQ